MLNRYDQLTQSIAKALEVSCQVNAALKVNTYSENDAMKAKREQFEADLRENKSGLLVMDMSSEFVNIPRDVKLVDAETLKFFYETILRENGTSLAILNGDYTKAQKEAYYEHALEADIKSLGQAFSRVIFSDREAGFGNEIVLFPNNITFMSMENKLTALQVGLPAGIFTKNEARELLGYAPIEGGDVMPRGYNEVDGTDASDATNADGGNNIDTDTQQQIIDDVEEVVKEPLLVGQIQSLTQIVADYQEGKYTYNQALNMLMIAVGLSKEDAEKILDKQDIEEGVNNE
jgi:hypothetical protein